MPSPCGERIDITFVLKSIIDSYPAGGAVLRELLQNSDDAGARSQIFRLDTTSYSEDGLTDLALARCQGPSLVAINDSTFSPKDWEALTTVHDSSKTSDESKTGKYGIGFRSCYHLTENPQVYSDASLLILDPHREFMAPYAGGVKLESSDRNNPAFNKLFQPFASLNPNFGSYKGSAIRLPLRTADQAQRSKIKSGVGAAVTVEMVREWFQAFIKTELHEVLLFLKHITSVTFEIVNGSDISTIAYTRLANTNLEEITSKRSGNRGRQIETSHYILDIKTNVDTGTMADKPSRWMIVQFVDNIDDVRQVLSQNLTRDVTEVEKQMTKEKLLPHVALAFPLQIETNDPPFKGRLFSLLPVPIFTGFPLHIHAVFALLASRQHLRNRHEEIAKESLERLLVEWNHVLFNTIIPRAWSYLLQNIHHVVSTSNIYSAWPDSVSSDSKQGDSLYWAGLPARLLKEIAPYPVWPSMAGTELLFLNDVLVASDADAGDLMSALKAFAIPITCPSNQLFELLFKDKELRKHLLSPAAAVLALEARIDTFQGKDSSLINALSEYIALARDVSMFRRLPLLQTVSSAFIKLAPSTSKMFLASNEEADLFGDQNPQMLALDRMRPNTSSLVVAQTAYIHRLNPSKVVAYLQPFHHSASPNAPAATSTMQWLCKFWSWASTWEKCNKQFIKDIQEYNLIPANDNTARRVSKRVLDPAGVDEEALEMLGLLAIPSLHPSISETAKEFLEKHRILASSDDLGFILEEAHYDTSVTSTFTPTMRRYLQCYLSRLPYKTQLSKRQTAALRALPLFPILPPGDRRDTKFQSSVLEVAGPSCHFVNRTVVVIPILDGITFVDGDECHDFVSALRITDETKGELDVLQLVLDRPQQWQDQPPIISERLLERLFSRLSDLPWQYKEKLAKLSFVDVGSRIRPPVEVVDPDSPLARLYDSSEQELPVMTPAFSAILLRLQQSGFLRSELSTAIIEERLHRMDPSRRLTLLEVIDYHYQKHGDLPYDFLPQHLCYQPWIPSLAGPLRNKDCRDQQSSDIHFLYDLTLSVIEISIQSENLRRRLGWDGVLTETLMIQMGRAVDVDQAQDSNKAKRIYIVIKELATRYKNKAFNVASLQSHLGNRPWIPMSDTEFEFADNCMVDPVDLGPHSVFRQLPLDLKRDDAIISFLKLLGVRPKPTTKLLISELQRLHDININLPGALQPDVLKQVIGILMEITRREPLNDEQHKIMPIPIRLEHGSTAPPFRSADRVCFNDMSEHDSTHTSSMAFAHQAISLELADRLKLPHRSDLEFEQLGSVVFDAFTDTKDLQSCIHTAIASFSNTSPSPRGWIADAVLGYAQHAGASNVSFICNEKEVKIRNGPSPALSSYFQGPSLAIHHSATCSNHDIESLKTIARDGRPSTPSSLGPFAFAILALLSLGDIVMLISGTDVIFFDPSKASLPKESRLRGGARRTGLQISLENCKRIYPDYFAAIEGVEGFDSSKTEFTGTILVVPLRTETKAALSSKITRTTVTVYSLVEQMQGAFYINSSTALFFTRIQSVKAFRRRTSRALHQVWSVEAVLGDHKWVSGRNHHRLTLTTNAVGQEAKISAWLIVSSQAVLPPMYAALALPRAIPSALAVQLSIFEEEREESSSINRLFKTLPLPITTNLNMHINAPWVLSEDSGHQQLYLDSTSQQQPTLEQLFNLWLLSGAIPSLILHTVALLNVEGLRAVHNIWPGLSNITSDDLIAQGFYQKLTNSKELLLRTPSGRRVSPSEAVFGFSNKPSVHNLLQKLESDRFVIPSFDPTFLPSLDAVETDSPAHVHKVLLDNARQILNTNVLDGVDVDELIWYLLKAQPNLSLVELPLLRLQTGAITRFSASHRNIVFEYNAAAAAMFGDEDMMIRNGSWRLGRALIDELVRTGEVNVRVLDAKGLKLLLARSRFSIKPSQVWSPPDPADARRWIEDFWKRLDQGRLGFGAEISPIDLDDLPLFSTVNGPFISLSSCRNRIVFWRQARNQTVTTSNVLDALIQLGAHAFDNYAPLLTIPVAKRYRLAREVNITSVLDCLGSLGPSATLMDKVSPRLWSKLAAWIKCQDVNVLHTHDVFRNLPIWETRHSESTLLQGELKTLGEVYMLPQQSDISTITKYMVETSAARLARESPVLRHVLPKTQILSAERLVQELHLPDSLSQEEIPSFKAFLQILQKLRVPVSNLRFIPNGRLQLSHPDQIFHHQKVPLYTFAFQQQPERFVHKHFLDMMVWFETMPVNKEVTPDGLITALAAIDELIRSEHELVSTNAGIEAAYAYLNQRPKIFEPDYRAAAFKKIRGLRFVERQPMRSKVHELEYAAIPVPAIASLDQLVSEENYLVAWTQRGRFITDPTSGMKLVFPKVGSPTPVEVVAHLATLAKVARTHPQIATRIIPDIKATYQWLSEHRELARSALRTRKSEPIFWNVDAESGDMTVWHSATSMWFNLEWDEPEASVYTVKGLLDPYPELLEIAGVRKYVYRSWSGPTPNGTTFFETAHLVASDLRTQDKWTDVELQTEKGDVIRAHRIILAASSPYFMHLLENGGTTVELPKYSYLEIRSAIDYIYTGQFTSPHPPIMVPGDASRALSALINLFELANQWELSGLKLGAEKSVVDLKLVGPSTVERLLRICENVEANHLLLHCKAIVSDERFEEGA